MKIDKALPFYTRIILTGLVVVFGLLTIIASGPNKVWVRPGATQMNFIKTNMPACKNLNNLFLVGIITSMEVLRRVM